MNDKVSKIINQVEKIIDLFAPKRNEYVLEEKRGVNLKIILFFLSLYKDEIISIKHPLLSKSSKLSDIKKVLINFEKSLPEKYLKIYSVLIGDDFNFLNPILDFTTLKFNESLFEINHKDFKENFTEIFEYLLFKNLESLGFSHLEEHHGEYLTNPEISDFMLNCAKIKKNSDVFNPFAGLASFSLKLDKKSTYYGQEINHDTWVFGMLRSLAHNLNDNFKYENIDSTVEQNINVKFDLIIYQAPLNLRGIENYINDNLGMLKKGGQIITLLSKDILYGTGKSKYNLRKKLIDKDLIDTIVLLPANCLGLTNVSAVLLIINNDKKEIGKVKFIDAEKIKSISEKNFDEPRKPILLKPKIKYDEIINIINSPNSNEKYVSVVNIEKIKQANYMLNPFKYSLKTISNLNKNERLIKLHELLKVTESSKVDYSSVEDNVRLIRHRDLSDDKVSFHLKYRNIKNPILSNKERMKIIKESCLLISSLWNQLKPTYFQFLESPILLRNDIFSFNVNEKQVDISYLINEFHQDYVLNQIEANTMYGVIPRIRLNDFLEIKVKLPPLEDQKIMIKGFHKGYKELTSKIAHYQDQKQKLSKDYELKTFDEFASMRHTLGRPRQNIMDWSELLINFLNKNPEGLKQLNELFIEKYDTQISSVIKEIKSDIIHINKVLEKGKQGFLVENYILEKVSLDDFNGIIQEVSNQSNYNFNIEQKLLEDPSSNVSIETNRHLLKVLFDNILTNADNHGFNDSVVFSSDEHEITEPFNNLVKVTLKEEKDCIILTIQNNGKPFPKNFNKKKFIRKFSTGKSVLNENQSAKGSGLGGYDINRIALRLKSPDWNLDLKNDSNFKVSFKFIFKKIY